MSFITETLHKEIQIKASRFCLLLAAYFAFVLNFPFMYKVSEHLLTDRTSWESIAVVVTIPLFLLALFFSLFSILSLRYIEKPIFILMTVISSILTYGYSYYGLVFDDHTPIIAALEQTNWEEVSPFLTPSFFLWLFLWAAFLP